MKSRSPLRTVHLNARAASASTANCRAERDALLARCLAAGTVSLGTLLGLLQPGCEAALKEQLVAAGLRKVGGWMQQFVED